MQSEAFVQADQSVALVPGVRTAVSSDVGIGSELGTKFTTSGLSVSGTENSIRVQLSRPKSREGTAKIDTSRYTDMGSVPRDRDDV